ncbi:hypothetical protein DM01DRAFT_1305903 [Hesseltinella vesiculosa]|uniref:Velvet domain-containing protein n=1 Tax=Hesseltinella vesiculosa TaxID=101127 RepID=A0A1X2GH51_9FUNG|nr:hypothetical protein DM01DRAFT_1305903 [Hesseltinella vesiculosa]
MYSYFYTTDETQQHQPNEQPVIADKGPPSQSSNTFVDPATADPGAPADLTITPPQMHTGPPPPNTTLMDEHSFMLDEPPFTEFTYSTNPLLNDRVMTSALPSEPSSSSTFHAHPASSSTFSSSSSIQYTHPSTFSEPLPLFPSTASAQAAASFRQESDVFNQLISLAKDRTAAQLAPSASGLVSTASTLPASSATQTLSPSSFANPASTFERQYELVIIQQPLRARMCGYGDKDRRPVSPPPILQMIARTKDGHVVPPSTIDTSFFVVVCDSWHEDEQAEANLIAQTPSSSGSSDQRNLQMRNLVGTSVASANKLYGIDGQLGIFFVFHDISFRMEGNFKLRFSLTNLQSPQGHQVNTASPSPVLTETFSNTFVVLSAKRFPGVVRSTELSKWFAKQGVKIPVRKESEAKQKDDSV